MPFPMFWCTILSCFTAAHYGQCHFLHEHYSILDCNHLCLSAMKNSSLCSFCCTISPLTMLNVANTCLSNAQACGLFDVALTLVWVFSQMDFLSNWARFKNKTKIHNQRFQPSSKFSLITWLTACVVSHFTDFLSRCFCFCTIFFCYNIF